MNDLTSAKVAAKKAGDDWRKYSESDLLAKYGPSAATVIPPEPAPTATAAPDQDYKQAAERKQLEALKLLLSSATDEARVIELIREHSATGPAPTVVKMATADAPVVAGAHHVLPDVLFWLQSGENVFLHGPAGTGKTTMLEHIGEALELDTYFCNAILQKYELLGFVDGAGRYHETEFYRAYKNGGVFLQDEVDASHPEASIALNMAIENGKCTFPNGERVNAHEDFRLIAGANTVGTGANVQYIGRNPIDAATRDRYVFIHVDYDPAVEKAIADSFGPEGATALATLHKLRRAADELGIAMVLSMRAIRRMAKGIKAGFDRDRLLEQTVFKGLAADQVAQITAMAKKY